MLVNSNDDVLLPDWLKSNIEHTCVCGSPIMNYYNEDGKCTNRVCSNDLCFESVARKLLFCVQELGLKGTGIGVAKCRELAKQYCNKSHFQAFPYLFNKKPKCSISMYLKLCCIYGMDNRWNTVAGSYKSVDDFLLNYNGQYRDVVDEHIDLIKDNVSYVDFVSVEEFKYKPVVVGNIMITGELNNIRDRRIFPYALKKATNGLVDVNLVGKRKTDVMALIKEASSPTTDKVRIANENGIPIYTSEEFIEYVGNLANERSGGLVC